MIGKYTVCAATLLSAGSACAADVIFTPPPVANDVMIVAKPDYKWTGFYLGALLGYHWTDLEAESWRLPDGDFSVDNWVGGGFFGFNYHFENNLVLGLEGEVDYTGGADNQTAKVIIAGKTETGTGDFDLGWGGSLRARVGYAFDRSLVYATGGGQLASGRVTGTALTYSMDTGEEAMLGWTVGAGVEQAFTDHLFGRFEYRYTYYPEYDHSFGWDPDFGIKASQSVIKAGLGYKF